jgi:hypothetical protein
MSKRSYLALSFFAAVTGRAGIVRNSWAEMAKAKVEYRCYAKQWHDW